MGAILITTGGNRTRSRLRKKGHLRQQQFEEDRRAASLTLGGLEETNGGLRVDRVRRKCTLGRGEKDTNLPGE